jgi:hypothetical protein
MQFQFSAYRVRLQALPKSNCPKRCRAFSLAVLPLLVFLSGCAGAVTPSSAPSGNFGVSGSISPSSNGSGATVALSGPASTSTTASSSGNYSFSGLVNGTYAVTPSRTGYVFTPNVQSFTIDGSDVSGIDFTASPLSTHTVLLTWNASTSLVKGYNVYRSTTDGGPYSKINSTLITLLSYTDSGLATSTTYYYVTTAVNAVGVESAYSNQVSAKIP